MASSAASASAISNERESRRLLEAGLEFRRADFEGRFLGQFSERRSFCKIFHVHVGSL